jgi:hypothetical protein
VQQVRKRLTYANVVSSIALFIALSGATAFAVQQLPEKSVGERQLRPGAVTATKLRKNAVTAPKIKALAVKNGKIANGAVTLSKIGADAVNGERLSAGAVSTDKIANGAVTGDKVDESSLGEVPSASKANFATTAGSANPVAFAKVELDASVESANSKGISSANVKSPVTGTYCIKVPSFSPKGAQVTPEYNGSGGLVAQVTIGGTGNCPAPEVEVQTWNGGVVVKAPFYIVLYS